MAKTKTIDSKLPVPAWYKTTGDNYRDLTSEQDAALLQREGLTHNGGMNERNIAVSLTDHDMTSGRKARISLALQTRNITLQLLIEQRRTNALLEKILAEAKR